ncbi:exodeoxyribonuclease VII small subunit [Enterococcus rivorum]|uniref:exodeoxyribonuclease VII small subunit n=1 Tax=Enterococcus rivorum TaxID=762845 RepID=UPI00362CCB3E
MERNSNHGKSKRSGETFEESLNELEGIVQRLERGDVPLEEALVAFQEGVALSKQCQDTLEKAEKTLTKMMTENNEEVPFEESEEA